MGIPKQKWAGLKTTVLVLGMLAISGLFLACAPSEARPNNEANGSETSGRLVSEGSSGPVTYTIRVVGRSGSEIAGLAQVIPQWEALTGHKVELIELPYSYLQQRIFTDVWSEEGLFDVVLLDDPWFPALANEGYLTPLSAFGYQPDDDFIPRSLEVCMWPPPFGPRPPGISNKETPKLYALPLIGNVQIMWYRQDVIQPPPKNFDDFVTALETHNDPENNVYGYAYRGSGGNSLVTEFNAWNWAYGGEIFDENWNVVINSPESLQALQQFLKVTQLSQTAASNFSTGDVTESVLNGSALAAVNWPTSNIDIIDRNLQAQIAIIPVPQQAVQTSQLGNWLLAIPITSQKKQLAYEFMVWATSPEVMREMAKAGTPPTRLSVFNDPDLVAEFWWFPLTAEALKNATWRPRTPEWNKIVYLMSDNLTLAISGQVTPEEALANIEKQATDVMQRAGYLR
jgi:multiple sugar transport system substrate-binding protein